MDANQKLTQFMEAVSRSTDAEIEQKQREAEQEAQRLLLEAQAQCDRETERALTTARTKLTLKYQKQMSQVGYRGRTAYLGSRQIVLMQLFAELREKLNAFTASEEYLPWIKKILSTQPPDAGAFILMREKDLYMKSELEKTVGAGCSFRADPSILMGGLSVLSPDGRRCKNHTLDEAYASALRNFYRNHKIDGGNE